MYTVITQYYFILLCNALKCPVRYLSFTLLLSFFLIVGACGYPVSILIQLFSVRSISWVEVVHSTFYFLTPWPELCIWSSCQPFCVPRWNIHDSSWFFFNRLAICIRNTAAFFLATGVNGVWELQKKNFENYYYSL